MSLLALCQWLQGTQLSILLRESTWGFPMIGTIHVLGITWFGGAVLVVNLNALGWGMQLSEVARQLLRWKRIGLAVMLISGGLLFWLEPVKCYHSVSFRIKMSLLVLVFLINPATPARAKLAAGLSLTLWVGIILAAQATAFF